MTDIMIKKLNHLTSSEEDLIQQLEEIIEELKSEEAKE